MPPIHAKQIRRNGASNYQPLASKYQWGGGRSSAYADFVISVTLLKGALVHGAWHRRSAAVALPSVEPREALALQFKQLADMWKSATIFSSSPAEMAMHPAYQRIVGMGRAALPLIMADLTSHPDHWFWALQAISGEDPVPLAARGHMRHMADAWLEWGRSKGYLW